MILSENDNRNSTIIQKLKNTIKEITESNEKFDIVAKATSDIIRDWKIQENSFTWIKGIDTVFDCSQEEIDNDAT
jgi:hypothetical protein